MIMKKYFNGRLTNSDTKSATLTDIEECIISDNELVNQTTLSAMAFSAIGAVTTGFAIYEGIKGNGTSAGLFGGCAAGEFGSVAFNLAIGNRASNSSTTMRAVIAQNALASELIIDQQES